MEFPTILNGEKLKIQSFVIYLGVRIDDRLQWKEHITYVNIKISPGLGIINRLKHIRPLESLRNIYFSFCQSFVIRAH